MDGKVVFLNQSSRLGAIQIGEEAYVVFEFDLNDGLAIDDRLLGLKNEVGHIEVEHVNPQQQQRVGINVLSTIMDYKRAKLVVAPWKDYQHAKEELA